MIVSAIALCAHACSSLCEFGNVSHIQGSCSKYAINVEWIR